MWGVVSIRDFSSDSWEGYGGWGYGVSMREFSSDSRVVWGWGVSMRDLFIWGYVGGMGTWGVEYLY